MNGVNKEPIVYQFDHDMAPTTENNKDSPVGVNELVPHTERFIEMYNITVYRDGDQARDVALFNFTALHEKAGTRFKLAFWDRGVGDVRKHSYRILATINFERAT